MIAMDFQKATANRILRLFKKQGQNRVLLADEVGLGKTIIAKEVIQSVSKWHKESGDDHFKVIYICSNINIAKQNSKKLGVSDQLTVSDSRLSMQHLKIYQNAGSNHNFEQLIPLTPATSFSMTVGCGNQEERALMYAHLKRLDCFIDIKAPLSKFLAYDAEKYWTSYYVPYYEQKVCECEAACGNYIENIKNELLQKLTPEFINEIRSNCLSHEHNRKFESRPLINDLRRIFAQISLDKLEPDLVVMDEFQRFRDLISPADDEQGMLSKQFLNDTGTKVLLLSATPYKPYSTLEEISADDSCEHYKEFMGVMNFLFYDKKKNAEFKRVWHDYSNSLSEISNENLTVLIAQKNSAEAEMYDAVCRTERVNSGIIDDKAACEVKVSVGDIMSFCEAQELLDNINADKKRQLRNRNIPMDFVKSSPYLLSFMDSYQIKKEIEEYIDKTHNYNLVKKSKYQTLLLKKSAIHQYKKIPSNNARLDKLKETVFVNEKSGIENLLWIPPSKPYYKTGSIFDRNKFYSKTLVFSSWEMVPRMVAVMLSYEAELRTIGKLYSEVTIKRGRGYFATKEEKRYGISRLRNETEAIVTYPSSFLAGIYKPSDYMGQSLNKILKEIKVKISERIEKIRTSYSVTESTGGAKALLELLYVIDGAVPKTKLTIPSDAADVFSYMAVASPAVCGLRLFRNRENATDLAKEFIKLFNKAESSAILDLLYGKSEDTYYENVFKYCADGNIESMLDEYAHVLGEQGKDLLEAIQGGFIDTSSVQIDTMESFTENDPKPRIRTHFAVGYFNARVSQENVNRTENIRNAFNSPFRPFVLATTSIGQEGLDFHLYCRKIMHWNLPSNPIDLEQREGRINRYKCLSIRQNIANQYGEAYTWEEMFKQASVAEKGNHSDIIPYWCVLHSDDTAVKIERIVPMYPFSQDRLKYDRLIKILSLYRLTLGQPRQEELIEILGNKTAEISTELFIDLCPFNKQSKR